MPLRGDVIRAAERAHHRLMMDGDAERDLQQTTYDALLTIARRTHTERVPQVREALQALNARALARDL